MDLTLYGEAARVTEPAILEQMASIYRGIGWPAEAAGDGRGRSHGETLIRLQQAIHLKPGGQADLAGWPIGSHRDVPLPFHADATRHRM